MAGHSLGEYTALVCSDAIDFKTAIDVVRFRGQVMQQAVPLGQGAMAAILGSTTRTSTLLARRRRRARWSSP